MPKVIHKISFYVNTEEEVQQEVAKFGHLKLFKQSVSYLQHDVGQYYVQLVFIPTFSEH